MAAPMDIDGPPSAPGGTVGDMRNRHDSQPPPHPTPRTEPILESAKSWNASISQPPYIPQFSAATSLILSRIRGGGGGSHSFSSALTDASATVPRPDQHAFEDARSRLVQGMSTTLEMPPAKEARPPPAARAVVAEDEGEPAAESLNMGIKRKRDDGGEQGDVVDFTQNTMVMPALPPRLIPTQQQTHPQSSSGSAGGVGVKTEGSSSSSPYLPARLVDSARLQKIERIRQKRLAALPEGIAPAKPDQVGFAPGGATDHARREYFYNMKKTDVLNVLSFCDQLKPQLLVDIMVSVSKRHPDLPMFDSPDWDASIPQPRISKPHHKRAPIPGRSRHGPSLLNSKAKQKIKGNVPRAAAVKKQPLKRSRLAEELVVEEEQPEAEVEMVEEDAPPPTWPRAGEGLYAKLVAETEDGAFLADNNDEEAFSHFMVDSMGRQIVDPV